MRYIICASLGLLTASCGRTFVEEALPTSAAGGSGAGTGTTSTSGTGVGTVTGTSTGPSSTHGSSGSTSTSGAGSSTSGCATGILSGELGPCNVACVSCEAGLTCDTANSLCEQPCFTTADCPLLGTSCSESGLCQEAACSPLPASGGGGGVGAPCLMSDQTIGSCLYFEGAFNCVSPGSSASGCSPTATRATLGSACGAGFACGLAPSDQSGCDQECDPAVGPSDGCGTSVDVQCTTSLQSSSVGYCQFTNHGTSGTSNGVTATGGTNGGFTATASGGTNGGTGTSGGTSGGGCSPEFSACDPGNPLACGCGMSCVYEPLRSGNVCEVPCTSTAQCPSPYTVCTGVSCTADLCGIAVGGPPNGTLDGTCNASGTADGTCVAAGTSDAGVFGVCYQGGSATTSCAVMGSRNNPGQLCEAGYFCGPSFTGTKCYLLCNPVDPGAAMHCMSQGFTSCQNVPGDSTVGFCQ